MSFPPVTEMFQFTGFASQTYVFSLGYPCGLRLFVGIRFQVFFTPLVGVLFTFPSRYLFAIGRQGVLRLGGWSPHFQTGLHVSRLTQGSRSFLPVRGYHPIMPDFPDGSGS